MKIVGRAPWPCMHEWVLGSGALDRLGEISREPTTGTDVGKVSTERKRAEKERKEGTKGRKTERREGREEARKEGREACKTS